MATTTRSVPFALDGPPRPPALDRLEVFIGRWINEGYTVDRDGRKSASIVTSDVYEWMPGRHFVLHTAYGRIGDLEVGGTEILGYDSEAGTYFGLLFDSSGGSHRSSLTRDGDVWTWRGGGTGCTGVFTEAGRVQTAHHVRQDEKRDWVPAMEIVLRKIA
jgi:hypothetical protein